MFTLHVVAWPTSFATLFCAGDDCMISIVRLDTDQGNDKSLYWVNPDNLFSYRNGTTASYRLFRGWSAFNGHTRKFN